MLLNKYKSAFYYTSLKKVLFCMFGMSLLCVWGCRKFVEVKVPVTSTNAENVYVVDAAAAAVLTGIYTSWSSGNADLTAYNITSTGLLLALAADDLTLFNVNNTTLIPYYRNDFNSTTSAAVLWNVIFPSIYNANSAIEGLSASSSLTPAVKDHLLGEAFFIRAFCYYYLTSLYGDVPLVLNTNWKVSALLPRSSVDIVYKQIIEDLKNAQKLLTTTYLMSDALTSYSNSATAERTRPNSSAATALLARVYLTLKDWTNAELQASIVINNVAQYRLLVPENVFLKNSAEAIWQLQPVNTGFYSNTGDGRIYILPAAGPNTSNYPVYLSRNVVEKFENADLRKAIWVDSIRVGSTVYYYPKKYKIGVENTATREYVMMLRLGEQYLIRAEARTQMNNLDSARADLNQIRARAGLANNVSTSKSDLLSAILRERRLELFTEWGHRWFDLKRSGVIDSVMAKESVAKGGIWSAYKSLYPVPQTEINVNYNLIQNDGY